MKDELARAVDGALAYVGSVLAGVGDNQLDAATPCPDMTVADEAGHVTGGLLWLAGLPADGEKDPNKVPAPDGVPVAEAYAQAAAAFGAAWTPDALTAVYELPFGALPGIALHQFEVVELLGHGWDLAVATGGPLPDEDLAEYALAVAHQMPAHTLRAPGMMGDPVEVGEDRPAIEKLAGFLGRDPKAY